MVYLTRRSQKGEQEGRERRRAGEHVARASPGERQAGGSRQAAGGRRSLPPMGGRGERILTEFPLRS